MKHSIRVIFGNEEVNKFINDIPLSELEKEINMKDYHFDSIEEMNAFAKGVNESVGWNAAHQTNL